MNSERSKEWRSIVKQVVSQLKPVKREISLCIFCNCPTAVGQFRKLSRNCSTAVEQLGVECLRIRFHSKLSNSCWTIEGLENGKCNRLFSESQREAMKKSHKLCDNYNHLRMWMTMKAFDTAYAIVPQLVGQFAEELLQIVRQLSDN